MPATVTAAPRHRAVSVRPSAESSFRPEIQGLRAVAVGLVVLYHLWPSRMTGGYVGVDVFFVISGFLITSHLYRELRRTGRVSLREFWARRIRRLLPASLLVLALSVAAVYFWVPATQWPASARQIGASALYVENWALANDAVNYLALGNVPTVAQHYWSLSVEEQFYLVWPVLLLVCSLVGGRRGSGSANVRWRAVTAIAVLAAGSLAWSVVATQRNQSTAYFVTPTRVWEFSAGALLALIGTSWLTGRAARALAAWVGLSLIVLAAVVFDARSAFPGWIALLPVVGATAVIAGADASGGVGRLLALRPMRFVGDISYSVYLVHWPLVVVWPYVTGVAVRSLDKVAIGALSLVLAWSSKTLVEDPARRGRLLSARPWRSFVFALVGMAVVVGGAFGLQQVIEHRASEQALPLVAGPCSGPAALSPGCPSVVGTGPFASAPEIVALQNATPTYPGCMAAGNLAEVPSCTLGSTSPNPDRVVALVGDSHATQWFPALDELGKERNWKVVTYTKGSCPLTTAARYFVEERTDADRLSCLAWNQVVENRLLADKQISYVFTAAFSTVYTWKAPEGSVMADPRTDGFVEAWQPLLDAGDQVFVIADVPRTSGASVTDCLAAHPDDRLACAVPRAAALPGSALVAASKALPAVHVLDLTDEFCGAAICYPVVGNVIVYRDHSHLSAEYARALEPYLGQALDAALRK